MMKTLVYSNAQIKQLEIYRIIWLEPYIELEALKYVWYHVSIRSNYFEIYKWKLGNVDEQEIPLDVFKAMYQPITTPPKAVIILNWNSNPVNRSKLLTKYRWSKVDQPIEQLLDGYSVICIYNIKGIDTMKNFSLMPHAAQIKLFKHPVKSHEILKNVWLIWWWTFHRWEEWWSKN